MLSQVDCTDDVWDKLPDSVNKTSAVVKAVLAGRSDHIILPRGANGMTILKGLPTWIQVGLRKDTEKLMKKWEGRQVLQPSEAEKSMGESSIFEEIKST